MEYKEEKKSNIHSPGPTKAWHICGLITGLAFTLYFLYVFCCSARRKSCSHTRVFPGTALPGSWMDLLLVCCQVISRCGRSLVYHEQKMNPEVLKVNGRRRLRNLKNPALAVSASLLVFRATVRAWTPSQCANKRKCDGVRRCDQKAFATAATQL